MPRWLVLVLVVLACGESPAGDKTDRPDAEQRPASIAKVHRWQLTFDMEQSGEHTTSATGNGVTVSGKRSYSVTCSGSALLVRDQFGGFAGPVKSNCNYTSSGSANTPYLRGTMSGVGVAEPPEQTDAGLAIDPDRGEYDFGIPLPTWKVEETSNGSHCTPPPVITPTSQCVWTPFTQVTSERATVGLFAFRELPLPQGIFTLSGTNTDPPEEEPSAKRRVTWSFSPAGLVEDDVAVTIEGPACACLDGEKLPGVHPTWTARASQPGGTFAQFRVEPAGSAPKVVTNKGGASAQVTLEPTPTTGAVTLTAKYTYKGRASTATHNVEFCVLDSISIGDGSRDMSFDDGSPGNLRIVATSQARYNGADASAELAWSFESIGSAATTTLAPANPTGKTADVRYTGLPESNADFGKKQIEVSLDKGSCSCKRTDAFRAFYSPTAANHPATAPGVAKGAAPIPNWFYYYSQTTAIGGVPGVFYQPKRYSAGTTTPVVGQFDEKDGNIYLTDELWRSFCRPAVPNTPGGKPVAVPSGAGNDGIDCVAETVRHEAQHRADWAAWWPNGHSIPADPDLDYVPSTVELTRPGCSPVSRTSCDERPFVDVRDREITGYWAGWRWQTGSLDAQDWACGPKGKQWKGGYGCADDT